jgi:hypothetical protein
VTVSDDAVVVCWNVHAIDEYTISRGASLGVRARLSGQTPYFVSDGTPEAGFPAQRLRFWSTRPSPTGPRPRSGPTRRAWRR